MKSKALFWIVASLVAVAGCNKEYKELESENSVTAKNEIISESYSSDIEDLSAMAILTEPNAGGRSQEGSLDDRFACATVTRTADSAPYTGTIVIDFGAIGCQDAEGNVRKGKISINYNGKRYLPGSTLDVTLDGYSINEIKIEGIRETSYETSSKESDPISKTIVTKGVMTWPDGTSSKHEFTRTRVWNRQTNSANDTWTVEGFGNGETRKGVQYEMKITKPLKYKKECEASNVFIAVSGEKAVKKDAKDIVIDHGNELCNNLVTVTYNGASKVIEIGKKGD